MIKRYPRDIATYLKGQKRGKNLYIGQGYTQCGNIAGINLGYPWIRGTYPSGSGFEMNVSFYVEMTSNIA